MELVLGECPRMSNGGTVYCHDDGMGLMTFTDDDLKRLKEDVAKGGWSPKMPALLVRLEAAENVADDYECLQIALGCGFWIENPLFKAWRKSAGK